MFDSKRAPLFMGAILTLSLFVGAASCAAPAEAPRQTLPLVVGEPGPSTFETAQGYRVELTSARVLLDHVTFLVAGEVHASRGPMQILGDALIPAAHAHPGHYEGGDVMGEFRGPVVVDLLSEAGRALGEATLLEGDYTSANMSFVEDERDLILSKDPLAGHTALLGGVAIRGEERVVFTVAIDVPAGTSLDGVPFDERLVAGEASRLSLSFSPATTDRGEGALDAIDFASLDEDQDGELFIHADAPSQEDAYVAFWRMFMAHGAHVIRFER